MQALIKTLIDATTTPPVDAKAYNDVFVLSASGQKVMAELLRLYWINTTFNKLEPSDQTAFREGQRAVITFLLNRCIEAQTSHLQEEQQGE